MLRELIPTVEPLTRNAVRRCVSMTRPPGERPENKRRLAFLKTKLDNGLFHAPEWAFAVFEGREYRVDGQHSSKMLYSLSNEEFPTDLSVIIQHFEADTIEELTSSFNQFDNAISTRSNQDVVGAQSSLAEELTGIPNSMLDSMASGMAFHLHSGKLVDIEIRSRYPREFPDFVLWALPFASSGAIKRKPGVIAALFATYTTHSMTADSFWSIVATEEGPADTAPRILARFLRSLPNPQLKKEQSNPRAQYCKSLIAYNANRAGRHTNLRYMPRAPLTVIDF